MWGACHACVCVWPAQVCAHLLSFARLATSEAREMDHVVVGHSARLRGGEYGETIHSAQRS